MLSTLDRYIIRQFLGTFFFILVTIMAVAVVFDISEKAEDFAEMTASTHEIVVDYYLNFIIYYANLFSGLFIFLAVVSIHFLGAGLRDAFDPRHVTKRAG